jgi:hypothetical protein
MDAHRDTQEDGCHATEGASLGGMCVYKIWPFCAKDTNNVDECQEIRPQADRP